MNDKTNDFKLTCAKIENINHEIDKIDIQIKYLNQSKINVIGLRSKTNNDRHINDSLFIDEFKTLESTKDSLKQNIDLLIANYIYN